MKKSQKFKFAFELPKSKLVIPDINELTVKVRESMYAELETRIIQILKKHRLYKKLLANPEGFEKVTQIDGCQIIFYKNIPLINISPIAWIPRNKKSGYEYYEYYVLQTVREINLWERGLYART